jgi:hypothetical protein
MESVVEEKDRAMVLDLDIPKGRWMETPLMRPYHLAFSVLLKAEAETHGKRYLGTRVHTFTLFVPDGAGIILGYSSTAL